jgi:hypothetical protein
MKKMISLLLFIVIIFNPMVNISSAVAKTDIKVIIDGEVQNFDNPPLMVNNSTMVPMRTIFEALGAKIYWDAKTESVTALKDGIIIFIKLNHSSARVNGKELPLVQPAKIINGYTYVPLRFVSESLEAKVEWNNKSQTIHIQSNAWLMDSEYKILIDDRPVRFSVDPIESNGIILTEVASLIRMFDGPKSISMNELEVSGTIGGEFTFRFKKDQLVAVINGEEKTLPAMPQVIEGHLLVPIEFLLKELHFATEWDTSTKTLKVSTPTVALILNQIQHANLSSMKYQGDELNGKWHGKGELFNDGKLWYSGDFIDGTISGKGMYYYDGLLFYKGGIKDRVLQGEGIIYRLDGSKLQEGTFSNNQLNGNGKTYFANYENRGFLQYEGAFENGLRHGYGTSYHEDQVWYEGYWKDGKYHGNGKFYINGHLLYEGNWINSKLNGSGKKYRFDGKTVLYEGNFKDSEFHGNGTLYFYENKFVGTFIKGKVSTGDYYKKVGDGWSKISQDNKEGILLFDEGDYYFGQIEDKRAHGLGKHYANNGRLIYEGEFEKDKYHGNGIYFVGDNIYKGRFSDGSFVYGQQITKEKLIYEGNLIGVQYHGVGKLYKHGYLSYEGEFFYGEKNGIGKEFYINGIISYEGQMKNGKREGIGTSFHANGEKNYEGEYKFGRPHGKGKYYNYKGRLIYDGSYEYGEKQGEGKLYFSNGDYYSGKFMKGDFHYGSIFNKNGDKVPTINVVQGRITTTRGKGTKYLDNGDLYIGDILNIQFNGQGIYYTSSGLKYEGNFSNDEFNGKGSLYRSNGALFYSGEFKDNLYHGEGSLYDEKGNIIAQGEFKNDNLIKNTLLTDLDESTTIQSLQQRMKKIVINDIVNGDQAAGLFLSIESQQDYDEFMSLSHGGKVRLLNGYVQDQWDKHFNGQRVCAAYVIFEGYYVMGTWLSYQVKDELIAMTYFVK